MKEPSADQFVAGYNKGREDGIHLALALAQLCIDAFPSRINGVAMTLLPEAEGSKLANLIFFFGDSWHKKGRREEKERMRQKESSA